MTKQYEVVPILARLLKERGWTQERLEAESGVLQATISAFDKRRQHKDANLFAIRDALGLRSVDELFEFRVVEDDKEAK